MILCQGTGFDCTGWMEEIITVVCAQGSMVFVRELVDM
jgi:hypothetical protein